ncbi:MAG: DUF4376 domain-containing protein [[Clostridium] symbiosum]
MPLHTAQKTMIWGDAENQQVKLPMQKLDELLTAMVQAQVEHNDEIYQRQREMKEQLSQLSTLDEIRALTPGG